MGNKEGKEDRLPRKESQQLLAESSKLLDTLVNEIGCPQENAIGLLQRHKGNELEILRTIAEFVNEEDARNGEKGSDARMRFSEMFKKSVHLKEINALRRLGFSDVDAVRALSRTKYVEKGAIKYLLMERHMRELDKTHGDKSLPEKSQPPPHYHALKRKLSSMSGPSSPSLGKTQILTPEFQRRDSHDAIMLSKLVVCKEKSIWNPQLIRAMTKMKKQAQIARLRLQQQSAAATASKEDISDDDEEKEDLPPLRTKEDTDFLRQRLENFDLGEIVMGSDGNCQFRSVSHELFGSQEHHLYVRKKAVEYIELNRPDFQVFFDSESELEKFIQEMRQPKTWGDELTLKAIAESLNVSIHVMTSNKGFGGHFLEYNPAQSEISGRHAFLAYISPVHYNVMTLRDDPNLKRLSIDAIQMLSHREHNPVYPFQKCK